MVEKYGDLRSNPEILGPKTLGFYGLKYGNILGAGGGGQKSQSENPETIYNFFK